MVRAGCLLVGEGEKKGFYLDFLFLFLFYISCQWICTHVILKHVKTGRLLRVATLLNLLYGSCRPSVAGSCMWFAAFVTPEGPGSHFLTASHHLKTVNTTEALLQYPVNKLLLCPGSGSDLIFCTSLPCLVWLLTPHPPIPLLSHQNLPF